MERQDSENEAFYLLGCDGTIEVLEYIKAHPQCKKEDFTNLVEGNTVAELIKKLQKTGLVDEDVALTDKGKILLKCLGCLKETLRVRSYSSKCCIDRCSLPEKGEL